MTFRLLILLSLALAATPLAHAGMNADTPYTQRGKTDFDTALQLLNPYGTWAKIDGKWAFTPSQHMVPYTDGRWIYTEYGWYWKGRAPHSWATEHYGYWKRSADKVWSWYPGPYWLPQIVEIRATSKYIGWRSAEVDDQGSFVEAPIDRYGKEDEWTFVTLDGFANPITPDTIAKPEVAKRELEDSTDCRHTYLTYREIDRPGPHPADFADLCKDGKMLAPLLAADERAAQRAAAPAVDPNSPAAHMTGTNAPSLIGAQIDPAADTRKVKYWVTMSLPNYWATPPPDAKPDQVYLYRPDFFQDNDGIGRRITLWFNPKERGTLKDLLGGNPSLTKPAAPGGGAAGTPATPAIPASAANPFRSPLDETPRASSSKPATNASTKVAAPSGTAVPDGLAPQK